MIVIKKVFVDGKFDADITVSDVHELEKVRSDLSKSYGNGHRFEISFMLQTDNFEEVKYPKQKVK